MSQRDELLVDTLARIEFLYETEAGDEFFFDLCDGLRDRLKEILTKEEQELVGERVQEFKVDSGWAAIEDEA